MQLSAKCRHIHHFYVCRKGKIYFLFMQCSAKMQIPSTPPFQSMMIESFLWKKQNVEAKIVDSRTNSWFSFLGQFTFQPNERWVLAKLILKRSRDGVRRPHGTLWNTGGSSTTLLKLALLSPPPSSTPTINGTIEDLQEADESIHAPCNLLNLLCRRR